MKKIIVKPIVTEKSMQDSGRKFTFLVDRFATKLDIKNAIKGQFGIIPQSIKTIVVKGKRTRRGVRRIESIVVESKKATIFLKKGDKLSIFESDSDKKKK